MLTADTKTDHGNHTSNNENDTCSRMEKERGCLLTFSLVKLSSESISGNFSLTGKKGVASNVRASGGGGLTFIATPTSIQNCCRDIGADDLLLYPPS